MLFLLSQMLVDNFCLAEGNFITSETRRTHKVVKKHLLKMIRGETPYERLPRLFSYAAERLSDLDLTRWTDVRSSGITCGAEVWEKVYLAFPEMARNSDPSVLDSAEALFIRMVRDSLETGAYLRHFYGDTTAAVDGAAWDVLALSSFLYYLGKVGVRYFREMHTCGYW